MLTPPAIQNSTENQNLIKNIKNMKKNEEAKKSEIVCAKGASSEGVSQLNSAGGVTVQMKSSLRRLKTIVTMIDAQRLERILDM